MQYNSKPQAMATYNGETVFISDVVWAPGMSEAECLINYDGPQWVFMSDLTNITWYVW